MAEIKIKNFGPIKDAAVTIRQVNVFIGPTSTGKSTVAKLIAIFNTLSFIQNPSYAAFEKMLIFYNINYHVDHNTDIQYISGEFFWRFRGTFPETNFHLTETIKLLNIMQTNLLSATSITEDEGHSGFSANENIMPLYFFNIFNAQQINSESNSIQNANIRLILYEILGRLHQGRNGSAHNIYFDWANDYETLNNLFRTLSNELGIMAPIYIPAERITMAMVAESIFGLLKNDVSIPAGVKDFGAKFETARHGTKEVLIDFFNIVFYQMNNSNVVRLQNGEEIRLEQAASGFQSLIPMYTVVDYFSNKMSLLKNAFVIEEPELNLYPSAQKSFIEYLVKKTKASSESLFITTHSPYVLTTLDNLIQANNAVEHNPQNNDEVAGIVDPGLWLKFSDVSCYYFSEGTCRSTLDVENQSIGASNIDDVSIELGKAFDQLLELKYN